MNFHTCPRCQWHLKRDSRDLCFYCEEEERETAGSTHMLGSVIIMLLSAMIMTVILMGLLWLPEILKPCNDLLEICPQ